MPWFSRLATINPGFDFKGMSLLGSSILSEHFSAESDSALMRRCVAGETACFAEIVRRYQRPLQTALRSRLRRIDWAEEVVQETFFAAFKSRHTFDCRFSFRTWLWTILLNHCRGQLQRQLRKPRIENWTDEEVRTRSAQQMQDPSAGPVADLLERERSALLESLLEQVSEAQADAYGCGSSAA